MKTLPSSAPPVRPPEDKSIFDLLTAYHHSLENMKAWLSEASFTDVERIGIIDAWQEEMREYFAVHGYCFACNRTLSRCRCEEPPTTPPSC